MAKSIEILKQYWGYETFRPKQHEIIKSINSDRDTIAILPTGGGKSVCYQIPALEKSGVCIVISPLLSLIKDQIEKLKQQSIRASYISSELSFREIDIILDNCIYGSQKFLYIAPERISTEIFQERIKYMNISMIAIDEAHCISQWGHDFRPSYLNIKLIREIIPNVPIIALTATATKKVIKDIALQLELNSPNLFCSSFKRENLGIRIINTEKKFHSILEHIEQSKGSAIIYTRSRKLTESINDFLNKKGVLSTFYHAGLSHFQRSQNQELWRKDKLKVIVATNAFGMGIDKPDVRMVIHISIPDSIENYYQEIGRGGRDGSYADSILLYDYLDIHNLKKNINEKFPPLSLVKDIYSSICKGSNLAYGSGKMISFPFDIKSFSQKFNYHQNIVFNSLKILESEKLLKYQVKDSDNDKVKIAISHRQLYQYRINNPYHDNIIKILLRIYGGEIFEKMTDIEIGELCSFSKLSETEIRKRLETLSRNKILKYKKKLIGPQITLLESRIPKNNLILNQKKVFQKKIDYETKVNSILNFISHQHRCRRQIILEHFGEISYEKCGMCDICLLGR